MKRVAELASESTTMGTLTWLNPALLQSEPRAADIPVRVLVLASSASTDSPQKARERVQAQDELEARRLASRFVERLRDDPTVEQVWAQWERDFTLTAVVNDDSLENELRLRATFIELAAGLTDPSLGELDVLPPPCEPEDAELIFSR